MSKPRKHYGRRDGRPACGRVVLDLTTITREKDDVTCPKCLAVLECVPLPRGYAMSAPILMDPYEEKFPCHSLAR